MLNISDGQYAVASLQPLSASNLPYRLRVDPIEHKRVKAASYHDEDRQEPRDGHHGLDGHLLLEVGAT